MKFITDSASLTGAMHIPEGIGCQDYATSKTLPSAAYAVVCDGSSCADDKGKPNREAKTGVGASILALATGNAIVSGLATLGQATAELTEMIRLQQQLTLPLAKGVLGLAQMDLAATCLYAVVTPTQGVIHVQGDGVVAMRKTDGSITMLHWDWPKNGPFYPSYATIPSLLSTFVEKKGGYEAAVVEQEEWIFQKGGSPELVGEHKFTVREGVRGILIELTAEEIAELEGIFLFSDGITSVCSGTPPFNLTQLDWKEMVVRVLHMMKHPVPNFAMSRLDRWQDRDVQSLNARHQDDLTVSAIRIIHEQSTV